MIDVFLCSPRSLLMDQVQVAESRPFMCTQFEQYGRRGELVGGCNSIIALAKAHVSGELSLDSGVHHDPHATIERLAELPGIGPWTAHYIAMRALRWPDAFPKEGIAILNRLGGISAKQAEQLSQAWRPWRSGHCGRRAARGWSARSPRPGIPAGSPTSVAIRH